MLNRQFWKAQAKEYDKWKRVTEPREIMGNHKGPQTIIAEIKVVNYALVKVRVRTFPTEYSSKYDITNPKIIKDPFPRV